MSRLATPSGPATGRPCCQTRNRSLMLLGFWRGFRSDELVNLRVENIEVTPGQGMACYLGRTKGDR